MTEPRGESEGRTATQVTDGQGGLVDEIPWKQAVLFGIGAFVVGMVLTTGLVVVDGALDDTATDTAADTGGTADEPGFMTVVGWVYFGAQFVDIEMSWALGTESLNLLDELSADASIPTVVYYLVPVVSLVGAGRLLAKKTLPAGTTPEAGAKMGAYVTVGYLVAVFFATQLFTWSITEDGTTASVEAAFTEALLVSGLIYPILFGAIGGYLAFRE